MVDVNTTNYTKIHYITPINNQPYITNRLAVRAGPGQAQDRPPSPGLRPGRPWVRASLGWAQAGAAPPSRWVIYGHLSEGDIWSNL